MGKTSKNDEDHLIPISLSNGRRKRFGKDAAYNKRRHKLTTVDDVLADEDEECGLIICVCELFIIWSA